MLSRIDRVLEPASGESDCVRRSAPLPLLRVGAPCVGRFAGASRAHVRALTWTTLAAIEHPKDRASGAFNRWTKHHNSRGLTGATRDLSAELAPQGIRVVGLRPHGMPETSTMKEAFEIKAKALGMTWEQFQGVLANWSHPRRVMTLAEMANMAVFLASDKAGGMTGTTVNLTMGSATD